MGLLPCFHGNLSPHPHFYAVDIGSLLDLVEGAPSISTSVLPVAGSVKGEGEGASSHTSGAVLSDFKYEELPPSKAPMNYQPQMCVMGCSEKKMGHSAVICTSPAPPLSFSSSFYSLAHLLPFSILFLSSSLPLFSSSASPSLPPTPLLLPLLHPPPLPPSRPQYVTTEPPPLPVPQPAISWPE